MNCPICNAVNTQDHHRCQSCGADFSDPDVKAVFAEGGIDIADASLGKAGTLSSDTFLGFSSEKLFGGRGLNRLALIGAAALLASCLIPMSQNYRDWMFVHEAIKDGPVFALLWPAIAAAIGMVVAFAPGLSLSMRASALVAAGLVGLFQCTAALGRYAAAAESVAPIFLIGMLVAGCGLAVRLIRPLDMEPRYAIVAGAAIAIVGMALPIGNGAELVAGEYSLWMKRTSLEELSLLGAHWAAVRHSIMVQVLALVGLSVVPALVAAAAYSWRRPEGIWDNSSMAIRPLAWFVVLYIPVNYALMVVNMTGWQDLDWVQYQGQFARFSDFTMVVITGRVKLAVISACFSIWVCFGVVVLYGQARAALPVARLRS